MTERIHDSNEMVKGHVIAEDGKQYFVCGKNYIEVSEHFPQKGRKLNDLIEDVSYSRNTKRSCRYRGRVVLNHPRMPSFA